jgi:polyvinyl alcohol dehydrogenase (cytochrome)
MHSKSCNFRYSLLALSFCAAACSSSSTATKPAPVTIKKSSADWNMLGYDVGSTYWNQGETKLTKKNVGSLEMAWEFDTTSRVTGTPVIAAGKVYVLTAGTIAIDLQSGGELWRNPDVGGNSSLALSDGVLYANDSYGVIHALNVKDGVEKWQYTTPDAPGAAGFASPIVTSDYVIYALSTNEEILAATPDALVARGFIGALTKDGELAWQKYTVEGNERGATIWSTPSVDETLGIVYGATGNNHGPPATTTSDAFVAVPIEGGDFMWTQQIFEGDTWSSPTPGTPDNDFGANPIVFDYDGQKLVAGGNKGGDFWVVDRETGTVLKKVNLGPGSAFKGGIFVSGAWDGKRLLTVCNGATSTEPGSETEGSPAVLYALDPLTLEIQWMRQVAGPVYSPITVANGVGFYGKNATLQAFDTETGEVLFEFPTEGTIATAPAISNGYVVFGSGMTWIQSLPGSKYYAFKVP